MSQVSFIVVSSNYAHYFDSKIMAEQMIHCLCFVVMAVTFILVFVKPSHPFGQET